jgi:hypothetical protein
MRCRTGKFEPFQLEIQLILDIRGFSGGLLETGLIVKDGVRLALGGD